jgi:probable rRNA maturation factor
MSAAEFELEGQIICRARSRKLSKAWWQTNANKLALFTLETQKIFDIKQVTLFSYSLTLVNDAEIKELNQTYRKLNKATDVLSFPATDSLSEMAEIKMQNLELGDIVISLDKLKSQAHEYGHSEEREGAFLFLHGFLHLLGYDHEEATQEREMFALQAKILQKAGFERA